MVSYIFYDMNVAYVKNYKFLNWLLNENSPMSRVLDIYHILFLGTLKMIEMDVNTFELENFHCRLISSQAAQASLRQTIIIRLYVL